MMTQSSQQPLASHCEDKLTRSNTSNEHAIQGMSSQRTPPRNTLTTTHKVQPRENQTGQCQRLLNRVEQAIERALAVMDHDSGKMMNYCQLRKHPKYNKAWTTSSANEFGRLASGVGGRVKGTKKIRFIHQDDVPQKRWKDITYGSFQCNVRPEKIEEPNRT